MPDKEFFFYGLNGATGGYDLPAMATDELALFVAGEKPPAALPTLAARYRNDLGRALGVEHGVDVKCIDQTGWGLILAHDADPAIQEALAPLLSLRRAQAGDRFQIYAAGDGVLRNETAVGFLARHDVTLGPADPTRIPYYLLIAGSPRDISFEFQYELGVNYAVGRIDFDTPEEYHTYAQSVVAVEEGAITRPRRMAFFSPVNADDPATEQSHTQLITPLNDELAAAYPAWTFELQTREQANKESLGRLLGGDQTPALLFTAGHGMTFPHTAAHQKQHQGALVCQDWPGRALWNQPIPQDFYFAGEDLAQNAQVAGLLAFFFACYGAGTPDYEERPDQPEGARMRVADAPFVARLPQSLLAHKQGGALAVISHVAQSYGVVFRSPNKLPEISVFESTLRRLLDGFPVGAALEFFATQHAALSTNLFADLQRKRQGAMVNPGQLARLWLRYTDAKGYTIVGDPAVRLAIATQTTDSSHAATVDVATCNPDPVGDVHTVQDGANSAERKPIHQVEELTTQSVRISTYLSDAVADAPDGPLRLDAADLVARTEITAQGNINNVILRSHQENQTVLDLHATMVGQLYAQRLAQPAAYAPARDT